ncbi:MAG TPA: RecX family transcriptional regulator [Gaiellaceae bacterium]|nr:RecX family transcriptional regulator [Gaiellaceae bacterium]
MPAEKDPIDVAARALRHRDRSRTQVAERLARAGVAEAKAGDALEALERVGYVDDGRYAANRAAALAARGMGDAAIRHDLETAGVPGEAVEEALTALEPEADRARRIAARSGRTTRTAGQLARKGFSEDAIEAAVGVEIAGGEPGDV